MLAKGKMKINWKSISNEDFVSFLVMAGEEGDVTAIFGSSGKDARAEIREAVLAGGEWGKWWGFRRYQRRHGSRRCKGWGNLPGLRPEG